MTRPCILSLICTILFFLIGSTLSGASTGRITRQQGEQDAPTAILLQTVVSGLSTPLYVTNAKDGTNRLFIVEQGGRIKVLQPGSTTPTVFLDISSKVLFSGEQGMLGMAFHPQFAINGRFYVNYTRKSPVNDGATVIAEYTVSTSDPNVADLATERVFLTIQQPFTNHNGGMIEFGPDHYLYIGMGDGGSSNDPGNRAQNVDELLGKMLRIDVDTPNPPDLYSSPASNPFFGNIPGRDEIYAVGLRNPFRWSFDRMTGELYVADVGQGAREEIDILELGKNYGWRIMEGTICTPAFGTTCNMSGLTLPIFDYTHVSGRCSISGGYRYRGARSTLPFGAYVFGDYCTGEIWQLFPAISGGTQTLLIDTPNNTLPSFGEDEAGEIYAVSLAGSISLITASPAPPACTYTVNPTSVFFPFQGGSSMFSIASGSDCNWLTATNSSWITITSATSGTGSGTINFTVGQNLTSLPRTGRINIGGKSITIVQACMASDGCRYLLSEIERSIAKGGGTGTLDVVAGNRCAWQATTNSDWISVTSGSPAIGNGTISYLVEANPTGKKRIGMITVGKSVFTIKQKGR